MRLIQEVPEVEKKLEQGKMNLSTISLAKSFFNKEKHYTMAAKLKVLRQIEGKSIKQVEQELKQLLPATEDYQKVTLNLNKAQQEKLQRLKELKGMNELDLFDWMMGRALKQIDPVIKKTKEIKLPKKGRHIPMALKKALHLKDGGRCQYRNPKTGKQCTCRTSLQVY